MFGLFNTETERKRDNYAKLYDKLQSILDKHDKKVIEAEGSYSSYTGSVPNLSNTKIPSNDFDPKREELTERLRNYFDEEKQKRSDLLNARNQAYQRYIHYKNLAISEEEARREQRRKELEALFENGKR